MDFLFSNFQPLRTEWHTFSDTFYDLLPKTEQLDIAVGYITSDSLIELQKAVELNRVGQLRLIIGMHYFDRFTRVEYQTAEKLNHFLLQNHAGEVRLVTAFRFHGKLYSFHAQNKPFAGIIGSNNLSGITGKYGVYEAACMFKDVPSLTAMDTFVHSLSERASVNLDDAKIEEFKENNPLLEGQDFVERAKPEEIAKCLAARTEVTFEIPIKDEGKSNLNAFFGKGRENMRTGVVKPRHWYESEIIVSKKITSSPEYPKADSPTASFYVITDDGWKFQCKVSGDYSKNFRSEGDLRILGKWLKGRLENAGCLAVGEPVTREVLARYGRDSFSLTKTAVPNLWYLDFGEKK